MGKYKLELPAEDAHAAHDHASETDDPAKAAEGTSKLVTVGVVVAGAALFEAALIPGILLGAAAVVAPKYLPKLGERIQPLFNTTVRGAYKLGRKARSAVGEVREQMSDIVAEVEAEDVVAAEEPAAGVKA
jgi:hypothetical protein